MSQVGVPEDAVEGRHLAVALQEDLPRLGVLLQLVDVEVVVALPVAADPLREAEPLARGLDRRLKGVREAQAPEPVEEAAPPVDRAGNRRAEHAVEGDVGQSLRVVEVGSGRGGCPPGGVQPVQLLVLRRVVDRFHVAADPGALRLHEPEHRRRRNGGVRGVAAVLQHLQARLRSKRLAGCDHAVASEHLRARLVVRVPLPVAADGGDVRRRVGVPPARDAERGRRDVIGNGECCGGDEQRHDPNADGGHAPPSHRSLPSTHEGPPFAPTAYR